MAARMIDLSRLSQKQLDELAWQVRHGKHKPRFREDAADRMVFAPLAESISGWKCPEAELECAFRSGMNRRHWNGSRDSGAMSHYLGFLFETYVQLAMLKFAGENPGLISILRDSFGTVGDSCRYSADSCGTAVFTRHHKGLLKPFAEIDTIAEISSGPWLVPAIFEITLMNGERKDFKARRKSRLVEEMYGRRPYFCIVRPAYRDEETGLRLKLDVKKGAYREILVEQNMDVRRLAERLARENCCGTAAMQV